MAPRRLRPRAARPSLPLTPPPAPAPPPPLLQVSVYPLESVKGQAAATATHTTEAKAEVGSRKDRRRATYKPRGSSSATPEPVATVAVVAASTQP